MELLLGGTAQRRRGEVQQDRPDSSSTCLSRGCSGPMMSRASSGRRDTPVIRDRNTRNLGCDKRSVLRPAAASSTSCRHDAARAQIQGMQRVSRRASRHEAAWLLVAVNCACAETAKHPRDCWAWRRASQAGRLDWFQTKSFCRPHEQAVTCSSRAPVTPRSLDPCVAVLAMWSKRVLGLERGVVSRRSDGTACLVGVCCHK